MAAKGMWDSIANESSAGVTAALNKDWFRICSASLRLLDVAD